MMTNETQFIPVFGTEEKITAHQNVAGHVYFSSDTGKIFMDCDSENRVIMGGSGASLFYADEKNPVEQTDGNFRILKQSLESELADPKEGDLIINSDGTFYKVDYAVNDYIYCAVIAVSGTGGGGGQVGPSNPSDPYAVKLEEIVKVPTQFVYGQPYIIKFKATSEEDDLITYSFRITHQYGENTDEVTYTVRGISDNIIEFDVGSKLEVGSISIAVSATSDNHGQDSKKYTSRSCVAMELKPSSDFNSLNVFNGAIDFYCIPTGASQTFTQILQIYVDNILQPNLTKNDIKTSEQKIGVTIPPLTHGKHTIKAVLYDSNKIISKSLIYEIACVEDENPTPIIWLDTLPENLVNHNNMDIRYRVYDPLSSNGRTIINRTLNQVQLSELEVSSSAFSTEWQVWRVIGYSLGKNTLTLSCGEGEPVNFEVNVVQDTRDLDILSSGLLLNLDAKGRSLNENKSDREVWSYTNANGKTTNVKFNNFNWYNNGWKTDDQDFTCLRISNGASIEIPLEIFNSKTLGSSYSIEFMFKLRNVRKYESLIESKETGEVDETGNKKFAKVITSTDGVWLNYYKNHVGFCLGTQECFFTGTNTTVSGKYGEGEIVHVTFVVESPNANSLIYLYINGIASGVAQYTTDNFDASLKTLTINSDFCDVDLYKLRVYSNNLTAAEVVHNYIADYIDANMYDANQICEYTNGIPTIDYNKMLEYNKNHPENLLLPYMVIESPDNILPYFKDEEGDGREGYAITFKNPSLDRDWANGTIEKMFDEKISGDVAKNNIADWETAENYYLKHAPSFKSVGDTYLNVQGTSSQGYPRRNYKAKFKDAGANGKWLYTDGPNAGKTLTKWYLDSNIGETSFCLKADYMESSRSHNTGFANFVNTLYTKHPLQDFGVSEAESKNYKTAIYGFPIMLFHKYQDSITFIGLYNFNLDKSCKDSFGFTNKKPSKIFINVQATSDTTYNPLKEYYTMNEEKTLLTFADKFKTDKVYYERIDAPTEASFNLPIDLASAAECWQIEHNRSGKCSFKDANFNKKSEDPKYAGIIAMAAEDFEVRYSPDKDHIEQAIARKDIFNGFSVDSVNTFLRKKMSKLEELLTWVVSTDPESATNEPLTEPYVLLDGTTYNNDTPEYRLAKFNKEFEEHFDLEYSMVYFIMTEVFLCYDSRGKNCMLATWGPKVKGGNDIWYPIFYDIDTQLGINNSGVPYWDYFEEPTNHRIFSTADSVLWNNLWKTKKNEIIEKYNSLRAGTGKMTYEVVEGYYSFNPDITKSYAMKGLRPLITTNVDEYYKYIDPAIGGGYVDTNNSLQHTNTFFYCLQGTRQLQRQLLLRNRFNYIDSMWSAGPTYAATGVKQQVVMRWDGNYYPNTSDKWVEKYDTEGEAIKWGLEEAPWPQPLDTDLRFNVTPYLKQYIHMQVDDTKQPPVFADAGEGVVIEPPENIIDNIKNAVHHQQELIYFGGIDYMSSLGDLSLKYLDQFQLMGGGVRLKDIILGNDTPGYFNNQLKNGTAFALNDSLYTKDTNGKTIENKSAKTLLETLVLSNLTGLEGSVDVSGSEKLKTLRALNTSISSFKFADGVQLETAYLPASLTDLTLVEPTSLTSILSNATPYLEDEIKYVKQSLTQDTWSQNMYYVLDENAEDGYSKDTSDSYNPAKAYFIKEITPTIKYRTGLYIDGITNLDVVNELSTTSLQVLDIQGGHFGYDSYKLLKKFTDLKLAMINNQNLDNQNFSRKAYINLENVNWSPFEFVQPGEPYKPELSYKKKTNHYTMVDYVYNASTWEADVLNGYIFEFYEDRLNNNENVITDLSLLDIYINDYMEDADYVTVRDEKGEIISNYKSNWFVNTNQYADGRRILPNISGIIYVNNVNGKAIAESQIKNHYIDKYFKDLVIYAANVEESYLGKFVTNINNIEKEIDIQKFEKSIYTNKAPLLTPAVPFRPNYDFVGWIDPDGVLLEPDDYGRYDFSKYVFDSQHSEYIFTAKFELTKFNINFVGGDDSNKFTLKITYGDPLYEPASTLWIPYKDDSVLTEGEDKNKTYKCIGWTADAENRDPKTASLIDLSEFIANKEYTFYAVFDKVSVYDNVLGEDELTFVYLEEGLPDGEYYSIPEEKRKGYEVFIKNGVKLKGKITYPAFYKGVPVISIGSENGDQNNDKSDITHVFFEKKNGQSSLLRFNRQSFASYQNLRSIEIPSSTIVIGSSAFSSCVNLLVPDISNCSNLQVIEAAMYNGSGKSFTQIVDLYIIPGSVKFIDAYAYTSTNLKIKNIEIGSPENPTQLGNIWGYNEISQGGKVFGSRVFEDLESCRIYRTDESVLAYIKQCFGLEEMEGA